MENTKRRQLTLPLANLHDNHRLYLIAMEFKEGFKRRTHVFNVNRLIDDTEEEHINMICRMITMSYDNISYGNRQ